MTTALTASYKTPVEEMVRYKAADAPKSLKYQKNLIAIDIGSGDCGVRSFTNRKVEPLPAPSQKFSFFNLFKKKKEPQQTVLELKDLQFSEIGTKVEVSKFKDKEKTQEKTPEQFVKDLLKKASDRSWELYKSEGETLNDRMQRGALKDTRENRIKIFEETPCIITASSWAREKNPKEIVRLLKQAILLFKNIELELLSQKRESQIASFAVGYIADHTKLPGVSSNNTFQGEAGGGSCQSFEMLQKQSQEQAGSWANKQVADKKSLWIIKDVFKNNLLKDMGAEVPKNMQHHVLQGLYGSALKDEEFIKSLNLGDKEQDWKDGKLLLPIATLKEALQQFVNKKDTEEDTRADKTKGKSPRDSAVPHTLALAWLEALVERGGGHLQILNGGEEIEIHVKHGDSEHTEKMKATPSCGTAVEFYRHLPPSNTVSIRPSRWSWLTGGLSLEKNQAVIVK